MNTRQFTAVRLVLAMTVVVRAANGAPPAGAVVQWGGYQIPAITAGSRVCSISSGYESAFAVTSEGTAAGWGWNDYGETGTPVGLTNVVGVSVDTHTLALMSGGALAAWGDNREGQTAVPLGIGTVVAASAGNGYSMALRANGTV